MCGWLCALSYPPGSYARGMPLDIASLRVGFPALDRTLDGRQVAYLDGPGGTQVHESVIRAMAGFMEKGRLYPTLKGIQIMNDMGN